MGHHLSGDPHPIALRRPNHAERPRGADMEHVQPATGQPRDLDVAPGDDLLGSGRDTGQVELSRHVAFVHHPAGRQCPVLGVHHDRQAGLGRPRQRLAHDRTAPCAVTVVGEPDRPRRGHARPVRRLRPGTPDRDGADGIDAHRQAGRPLDDVGDPLRRIECRVGVGHAADRGETAPHRRGRSGLQRLLLGKTRIAQVNVDVDQAGRHHQAARIDHLCAFRLRQTDPERSDLIAHHQHVRDRVKSLRGVHHAATPDQDRAAPTFSVFHIRKKPLGSAGTQRPWLINVGWLDALELFCRLAQSDRSLCSYNPASSQSGEVYRAPHPWSSTGGSRTSPPAAGSGGCRPIRDGWREDPASRRALGAQAAGLNMGKPTEGATIATTRRIRIRPPTGYCVPSPVKGLRIVSPAALAPGTGLPADNSRFTHDA